MQHKCLKTFIFLFSLLFNAMAIVAKDNVELSNSLAKNTWLPRSFVSYSMHDIAQMQSVSKDDATHLNFSLFFDYMQNFGGTCTNNSKKLGAMPFWSGDNTLTIGNNDGAQLDAYQFGLGNVKVNADGIAGKIELNPKVKHLGADMMFHWTQNKDERGLYVKVHAPLGAIIIDPSLKEISVAEPDNSLEVDSNADYTYQFLEYSSPSRRQHSMSEAFFGGTLKNGVLEGNISKPIRLRKGRIAPFKQTAIRLGDITTSVGYNCFVNDKALASVGFKVSMPTGNVPTADYMLEPIFGRAGAWGVGAELSGSYKCWSNAAGTRYLNVLAQGEVLHLTSGRTPNFRSFDLKQNGPGSKYMLIQNYAGVYDLTVDPTVEIFTPQSIQQAVNITTLPVLSKFAVEGSCAVMVDYHHDKWNVAVGAEVWGRTQEQLAIDLASAVDLRYQSFNDFAVLGRQVSNYHIPGNTSQIDIATYYCEPKATISKSQDPVTLVGSLPNITKAGVVLPAGIADARIATNRIPANVNDALDIEGAQAAAAFTAKVTAQAGYTWLEREYMPSVSVIAGAEFTNNKNSAVQFWSVGVQGSLNF